MERISVKDRLPEDDENLAFYDIDGIRSAPFLVFNGTVHMCIRLEAYNVPNYFRLEKTDGWIWYQHSAITHWMPLPEPPKE